MQGPAAAGEHAEVDVLDSGDDTLVKNESDFFGGGVLDPDQQVLGGARVSPKSSISKVAAETDWLPAEVYLVVVDDARVYKACAGVL
jgi:hypothetical protein